MIEATAKKMYQGHHLYKKAVDTGRAIDNALQVQYTKGGTTNSRFLTAMHQKYFSFEAYVVNGVADRI
ncbi:MAG: hypothetical protein EOO43_08385 [Flavobacterium sp.]|nr:MAG: hypothetical protein EOO43_08385 [Flavobacterium sp.]